MPRGNVKNLVKNEDLKPEERRMNASKAGKASAKARREKRKMQEIAKIVLGMPCERGRLGDIERIDFEASLDANLTVGERAMLSVAKKAMKGDAQALAFLRDTAGEKPVDKVEVGGEVEKAADEIKALVASRKAGTGDG